ncbi:phospholipid-binding protein MlaC [Zobellella taiwanensis]|jgi:phospholipid transport system substrate-binding protein|uniref:Phospholipid-binding protein MlaC n=1 Tax=Zobellella taiwanensis TaxID=347535 RepID=A0A2P7QQB8_9GAMM|nr:phospholipid-binding protein MlaC [Zobellella taiwanensis]PSJ40149.1 phospholipid-binding protein MlaC [Zobellella taiwanensis]
MKRWLSWLLVLTGFWAPLAASASASDPYRLVSEVAQNTFDRLKQEQAEIGANPEHLRTIVREEMLPAVDVRFSAFRVIGSQLNSTTAEQRERFVEAFSDYLVVTYADALAAYNNQTLDIGRGQVGSDDKLASVPVTVQDPGKPDIKLEFKLRQNSRTGEWKVFDMVAEGISLLSAKQSELSGLIRQNGIDEVSRQLQEHTRKPVTPLDVTQ